MDILNKGDVPENLKYLLIKWADDTLEPLEQKAPPPVDMSAPYIVYRLESGNQSIPEKGFLTRVEAEEYASTCNCYSFNKKYRHVFTQEISRLIEIGTTR